MLIVFTCPVHIVQHTYHIYIYIITTLYQHPHDKKKKISISYFCSDKFTVIPFTNFCLFHRIFFHFIYVLMKMHNLFKVLFHYFHKQHNCLKMYMLEIKKNLVSNVHFKILHNRTKVLSFYDMCKYKVFNKAVIVSFI